MQAEIPGNQRLVCRRSRLSGQRWRRALELPRYCANTPGQTLGFLLGVTEFSSLSSKSSLAGRIAMNFETARMAMVESQIRPNGVRDPHVLNAFASVPRECFVPDGQKGLAYMDEAVLAAPATPHSPARYLLPPMVLARLLQFAGPAETSRALDVGGATGYSAAILAKTCGTVHALEASELLAARTAQCLSHAGIAVAGVHHGALEAGLASEKPFDLILVAGGVASEPKALLDQLAEGGRLVTIIRKGWHGHAYLFTKASGVVSGRPVFDAGAEFLPGLEPKPEFVF
jgi:protein-L-isoaspartate(D-aspartate) O-methyltransferase